MARHGILYCRMDSNIGRNVQYCCEKYGIAVDSVFNRSFPVNNIDSMFFAGMSGDTINTVNILSELIMLRDGTFNFSTDVFSE